MTLHLLNKTQQNTALIERMLSTLSDGDQILLIEDGVYNALPHSESWIDSKGLKQSTYVLVCDIEARGLLSRIRTDIEQVDDKGFVRLSCEADKVVSWF